MTAGKEVVTKNRRELAPPAIIAQSPPELTTIWSSIRVPKEQNGHVYAIFYKKTGASSATI